MPPKAGASRASAEAPHKPAAGGRARPGGPLLGRLGPDDQTSLALSALFVVVVDVSGVVYGENRDTEKVRNRRCGKERSGDETIVYELFVETSSAG